MKEEFSFIDNLLKILKEKGMKPAELCRKANIPKSAVSHWKTGGQPTMSKVIKIASVLDVSLDYLVLGENKSRLDKLYEMANQDDKQIIDIILSKYLK